MSGAVLMVHGVGSSGEAFAKLAPAFRGRGWRAETPTLRADLRTARNPPPELARVSLADYVAEAAAAAERLTAETGEKPLIIGHSMGGLITQKLAEAGLARAVILITPASPPDARAGPNLAQAVTFASILFSKAPETRAHRIWRFGFEWGVLNRVPKARHAALWNGNLYDSGRVYADIGRPDSDPARTAYVDETKVTVPMLVLGAAHDRTVPVADVRLCAKKYAQADYREYPDHGHWIVDEPGTDAVIADMFAWLDSNGIGA